MASQLALARAKEGPWVRTAALLDFLDTANRRYLVGIITPDGPFAKADKSIPATIGRLEPYPRSAGGRQADRAAKRSIRAKAALRGRGLAALEGSTVYLVFDQAELEGLQRKTGDAMVTVSSHDLLGKPNLSQIPADLAEELLREPQTSFGRRLSEALGRPFEADYRLPSLAAVVVLALQGRALWQSLDDARTKGGLQGMEATVSVSERRYRHRRRRPGVGSHRFESAAGDACGHAGGCYGGGQTVVVCTAAVGQRVPGGRRCAV